MNYFQDRRRNPGSALRDCAPDLTQSKVSAIAASVMDTAALTDALAGCDGVFHLAGVVEHSRREPSTINDVNIRGTLNCIDAASEAGVRRVVYASTSGVCAVSKKSDMSPAKDTSPYADTVASDWPYYASKVRACISSDGDLFDPKWCKRAMFAFRTIAFVVDPGSRAGSRRSRRRGQVLHWQLTGVSSW